MENKNKSILLNFIQKNRKPCAILGVALCGLLLALFAILPQGEGKENGEKQNQLDLYTRSLEQRLSETVSQIDGAGKVSVFLTLESSFETVYASNAKLDEQSSDSTSVQKTTEKQLATTSAGGSGEAPVIVKQLSPKIKGVLIVCEGGEDSTVSKNIKSAASVALNIPTSRIYVTGGKYSK